VFRNAGRAGFCSLTAAPGPRKSRDRVDPYQSIADTIVQLLRFYASVLMAVRNRSRDRER